MSRPIRVLALVVLAVTLLGACSSDGSEGGASTTDPTANRNCAWPVKADKETLNVAYPDTNATYWATPFDLAAGEGLRIHGTYPQARYFSFITYGPDGGAIDTLADSDILVDDGEGGVEFTVDLRTATADEPNVLSANPAVTDGEAATGTVIYRVYLPEPADDPLGAAGLPDVSRVAADGTVTPVETCDEPGASPEVEELVAKNGPATDRAIPPQPIFIRPDSGVANLYPNPDNTYVATIVSDRPGEVVIVRGKAPSVPDQLRYWSLCTNEYRKPYPVTACVADKDVVLDPDGSYTIVIASPEDKAEIAAAGDRITWLDWGSTEVPNLLLLRQMLPDEAFTEAAANLEEGALASTVMGPYTPVGVYCSIEAFVAGGPAACPSP